MADAEREAAHARDWRVRVNASIQTAATDGTGPTGGLQSLCRAAAKDLQVLGAAIVLMSESGFEGVVAASDDHSTRIAEIAFTVGEGPCHDAFAAHRPVLTPDLRDAAPRWPGYARSAHEVGVAAVFAFPLVVGASRLGVFILFAARTGSLTADGLGLALSFSQVAIESLLDRSVTATDDELSPELGSALDYRAEIYQAQGITMIDLGVSLTEALARMRAHAYSHDLDLTKLARDIVTGRMRLEKDPR